MRTLHLLFTPAELDPASFRGRIFLPVDALRATTCIAQAIASGCVELYPFDSPYTLELFSRALPKGSYVTAMERECKRVEGADLGNSPAEFSPAACAGRKVLMSTSNGSPLIKSLEGAEEVIALSFPNLIAVAERLAAIDAAGVVVCAGWKGAFAMEDALCGGALASELKARNPGLVLTEAARTAMGLYEARKADLKAALWESESGRRLRAIGFDSDIDLCSRIGTISAVPQGKGIPIRFSEYGNAARPHAAAAKRGHSDPETGAGPGPGPGAAPLPLARDASQPGAPGQPSPATGGAKGAEPVPGAAPQKSPGGGGAQGKGAGAGDEAVERKMTLGQHLNELRRKLIFSILIILAAFVVCFLFSEEIVSLLIRPIDAAFTRVAMRDAVAEAESRGAKPPEGPELEAEAARLKGKIIAFKPEEIFMGYVKISLLAGLFVSSPLWMWQIWSFVAAGLYRRERRYVFVFAPAVFVFFSMGVVFLYFVLLPIGLGFLLGFGQNAIFWRSVSFGSYVNFFLLFSILMGVVFQMPLVMLFLTKAGIVSPKAFSGKRRHIIVAIFVVAAVITPPDVVSQILVAVPLMFLFELGLILSKIAYVRQVEPAGVQRKAA